MMRIAILLLAAASLFQPASAQPRERPGASAAGISPPYDAERPIAALDSVWIEQLTWMEVRDAVRSGKTTAVIATGGVEQNGPYLVTGKHNVILRATTEAIARRLGNALVAPIVPFVPEGSIDPKSGQMVYPGTISVEPATFVLLLRDIARSLRAHGFKRIVFIGDSGGNQEGMRQVAEELTESWASTDAKALFVPEYYDWPGRQQWLAQQGFREVDEGLHDELSGTAVMLAVDPDSVRMKERVASNRFSINGIPLAPAEQTATLGRALVDHIADVTVRAIERGR